MVSKTAEGKTSRLDGLKWLVVLLLTGGAIYGNYYFSGESPFFRALGIIPVLLGALWVAFQTTKGAAFWELIKGANIERRKVVWPTRQERNQTTLVVVAFILVMALILWGLDSLFGWLTAMFIG